MLIFRAYARVFRSLDPGLHRRVSSTPSRSTPRGRPSAAIFLVIYRPLARGSFTYRFDRLSFSLCWWHTRVSQRFAVSPVQFALPLPSSPFHAWTVDSSLQFSCPPRVRRYYTTSFSLSGVAGLIVEDQHSGVSLGFQKLCQKATSFSLFYYSIRLRLFLFYRSHRNVYTFVWRRYTFLEEEVFLGNLQTWRILQRWSVRG